MATYKIHVNVHCSRPEWVFQPRNKDFLNTSYRLYLNNELMIERSWVWGDSNFIKEEILVDLPPGTICNLKLEPVIKNIAQAKFALTDCISNGDPAGQQQNDLEISFVI